MLLMIYNISCDCALPTAAVKTRCSSFLKLSFSQSLDARTSLEFAKLTKCDKIKCKQLLCARSFPQCNIIGSESAPVCATLCRACYASCPQDNSRTVCGQMHPGTAAVKVYSSAGSCSLGLGNTSVTV
jgi:hypothetical protein